MNLDLEAKDGAINSFQKINMLKMLHKPMDLINGGFL
jgi:hypothetical protein